MMLGFNGPFLGGMLIRDINGRVYDMTQGFLVIYYTDGPSSYNQEIYIPIFCFPF